MQLSEIKGESALDVLAELMEPIAEIMGDQEMIDLLQSEKPKLLAVNIAIKNHKDAVITALALLEQKEREEFLQELTLAKLPIMLLDVVNDPDIQPLFT